MVLGDDVDDLSFIDGRPTMEVNLSANDDGKFFITFEEPLQDYSLFTSDLINVFFSGEADEYSLEWKVDDSNSTVISCQLVLDNPS